jgi:TonB family protein
VPVAPPPADGTSSRPSKDGKKAPLGLILGGLALLLVLAIGGLVAFLAYQRITEGLRASPVPSAAPSAAPASPSPRTAQSSRPPATTGTLHVETDPPGAAVTVNGEARGVTPVDLADLPMGTYEVKLDLKGYTPATESVVLAAQAPRGEVKVVLARPLPTTGAVDVVSNPPGAAVKIDGAPAGQTPLNDYKLKPGSHRVEMSRDGFEPWGGNVTVVAGKRARVDAFLKAVSKPTATPPPAEVVDQSRVYVNSAQDVDVLARKISGASASYPGNAKRLRSGDSVSVRISFVVNETGEISDMKVQESADKVVDEAVMDAVRKWKYSPAVKKGVKVKVRVEFRQTFRAG